MLRDGPLRASDADREHGVERLRAAAAEGRLSADELEARVREALTAVTYSDLRATVADLPGGPGESAERGDRRPVGGRGARVSSRRTTVGGWALAAVRANPLLLIVIIPVVATAGAMLLAAAVTWMTLLAVVMILGGGRHRRAIHARQHGPWSLMWGADDRF